MYKGIYKIDHKSSSKWSTKKDGILPPGFWWAGGETTVARERVGLFTEGEGERMSERLNRVAVLRRSLYGRHTVL